ncbi:unnamed protein product [Dovyalis caffra]|uniref:J domain-containing protein n=1 Tax=Dovyalis caffra TaxID=77055 RepID=A0AAV1SR17_9ROSI|nr:unnamed protein product [Dovyalis caffra]
MAHRARRPIEQFRSLWQASLDATKKELFVVIALSWNVEDLMPPTERFIFNFNSKEELKNWHLYSDSEYGGLSSASLEITDEGNGLRGVFSGNLSLDVAEGAKWNISRSGFCGMRSKKFDGFIDLDAYDTIALKLKGDGRSYISTIYTENWVNSPGQMEDNSWQSFVFVPKDNWYIAKIPLARYLPTWRGNVIDASMEMNPSRILSMSLSVNAEGGIPGARSGPDEIIFNSNARRIHFFVATKMPNDIRSKFEHNVFSRMANGGEEKGKSNDFYQVLGLNKECTDTELRNAYKKLALGNEIDFWLDRCSASGNSKFVEEAKKKFQAIQEAYSVLSDTNKRFLYDVGVSDSDDDENGMGDFLNEMAVMMSQTKPSEKVEESFEELQELFDQMFQEDLGSFGIGCQAATTCPTSYVSYSDTSNSNNKRVSVDVNLGKTKVDDSSGFNSHFENFCLGVEHQQPFKKGKGARGGGIQGGAGGRQRQGRKQKVTSGYDVSSQDYGISAS